MSDIFVGIAYSLAGCGLLVLCIGIITSVREWLFLRSAIVTTGTITDRREGINPEGGRLYIYDILFKTRSDDDPRPDRLYYLRLYSPALRPALPFYQHKPGLDLAQFVWTRFDKKAKIA